MVSALGTELEQTQTFHSADRYKTEEGLNEEGLLVVLWPGRNPKETKEGKEPQ